MRTTRLFLIAIGALALLLTGPREAGRVFADADMVTNNARVEAYSFDGRGTVGDPVVKQNTNVSEFNQTATAFDDLSDGRSAEAEGTQQTTVDLSSGAKVDTVGSASATYGDSDPDDEFSPEAYAVSEFRITLEVTDGPAEFSLTGSIGASSTPDNGDGASVSIQVPIPGENITACAPVNLPAGCAGNNVQQPIDITGELPVGTHTLVVRASASAVNQENAPSAVADASFDLNLEIGCGGNSENASDDDVDGDNIPDNIENNVTHTDPNCQDTDGDGLLDPWEVAGNVEGAGFDLDEDGTPDVARDEVFGPYEGECGAENFGLRRQPDAQVCRLVHEPDPLHKDVYVEMDWQDCLLGSCPESVYILGGAPIDPSHHAPDITGLGDVVDVFGNAPVDNPDDTTGINLHILVDESIKHDHNCDQGAAETRPTNFGTVQQRGNAEVVAAKEKAFRYAWSGHSSLKPFLDGQGHPSCPLPSLASVLLAGGGLAPLPEYDISPHGFATPRGRDVLVTLAVTWVCQLYTFDFGQGAFPPCFRTLAPTTGIAPGLFPADIPGIGGATIPWPAPIHTQLGIPYSQGVRQVWGRAFANLLGQSMGVPSALVGNSPNVSGPHPPDSYGSWSGLVYAPPSAGGPAGAHTHHGHGHAHDHGDDIQSGNGGGFVPILPDPGLFEQDADGDGTAEGTDNCPALDNPSQADLDGDGFGDACDPDEDGDGLAGDDDDKPGDTDNDGTPNGGDEDDDGDGLVDGGDNCALAANAGQENTDGDAQGDVCDVDDDGDGLPDGIEVTMGSDPLSEDKGPEFLDYEDTCSDGLDNDSDGFTDGTDGGCRDDDGDTAPNSLDNCPELATINVLDSDGDGLGDLCDPPYLSGDVDCSGAVNSIDALKLSRHVAGLSVVQTEPCPDVGTGAADVFGDVNCDGNITAVDTLFVLRFVAALPANVPNGCRQVGT